MKKKLVLILAFLFMLSALSFAAGKGSIICVTGKGSVQTEPDTASIRFAVEVSSKTAQESQSVNSKIMDKVINAIKNQGVKKEKIQTSGYNIWAEMKYEQNQPPKITGYKCSNQITVVVEDMDKISKIMDSAINAGANNVYGIQFFRKNDSDLKKEAISFAVKEAQDKAEAIAKASNLRIKGIESIVEQGAEVVGRDNSIKAFGMGGSSGGEPPISTGLLEIKAEITINYSAE